MTAHQLTQARSSVRIKSIALPAEHGGWGFLLEPVVLGLMLAPSLAGFYLALSAIGLFLARQPLTLVMLNRRRSSPRTALAKRFAALYVVVGTASLVAAFSFTQHSFFLPLLIAAPLAAMQLAHDGTGRRRVLAAEFSGAIAIAAMAPAIALSAGWSSRASFALWLIITARSVPTIAYVRACLARLHRRPVSPLPMLMAHVLALAAVTILARADLAPRLAVVVMVILMVRAAIGFATAEVVTAKQLGFSEIAFGVITVLMIAGGHALGV